MIERPYDILKEFPIRKSRKQKARFRSAVIAYADSLGYTTSVEKGPGGCHNILIGAPEKAKYLITAHYDTPAAMPLPNLITPCNPVTFLLYQLAVVGVFLGGAFIIGWCVGMLFNDWDIGYMAGWVSYWALLFLIIYGPANRNNANDNTSGVIAVLETAAAMPVSNRDFVCFVLFDLEEAGLLGSSSYRKKHKTATEKQVVLNMDCVGDGDDILLFPTKRVKKDAALMGKLESVSGDYDGKRIAMRNKGFSVYPSDQKNFPLGVGIAAFQRHRLFGLYCGRIHTSRDTVCDTRNINTLRDCLLRLIDASV